MEPTVKPVASAGAALDGAGWEGRRLLAQLLWVKSHTVLHAGAEERAARPGEQLTRAAEMHRHGASAPEEGHEEPGHEEPGHDGHEGHDGHDEHGHKNAYVLVIPPKREDFRGPIGDLERAVKPYADAKGRLFGKDPDQTVPFYRLMTWADPHFIQGYVVGAGFVCKAGRFPDQGLRFLHEGERYNPASPEIQTELGHFYLVYKRDYANAEKHLRQAIALVPKQGKLTEWQTEAQQDAYRWLALTYRNWGKPKEALATAHEGVKVIGPDLTLHHIMETAGRR
jgi:hypothetical protein